MNAPNTICLDEMFHLGAGHVDALVDGGGRTYFNVFLTNPAEAITDWPDFIDLPARYWEAGIMIEEATGRTSRNGVQLRDRLFGHIEPDGLAYRPESPISRHIPEMFDQSRLLYALVSALMHDPDDEDVRQRITQMIEALMLRSTFTGDYAYIEQIGLYFGGTLIRPILQAGQVCKVDRWIAYSGALARGLFHHSDLISADGSFKGHVHGALSAIAGALAYAIIHDDAALLERAKSGFAYAESISTTFGFVPELAQRQDDLIACETCTLMDYLDVALLLARHVDDRYWDLVEKATRNHLWESQIRDAAWLPTTPEALDEPSVIRENLPNRMIGAFAGWSAPHCLLAYHESHACGWVKSDEVKETYLGKIRAVQNCCAGGGVRAVFQVWSNVVSTDGATVSVNLSLDRSTPEVEVTSWMPFEGKVRIRMRADRVLRWRPPQGVDAVEVESDGASNSVAVTPDGAFFNFGPQSAGTELIIRFSLESRQERIVVGNAGAQHYRFTTSWVGDTVSRLEPDPANARMGRSELMPEPVPTSYGDAGIGPIYQRDFWFSGAVSPRAYPVAESRAVRIDWYSL